MQGLFNYPLWFKKLHNTLRSLVIYTENKLGNLTAYLNEQEKKKNNAPDVMDIFKAFEEDQKATTKRVKAS